MIFQNRRQKEAYEAGQAADEIASRIAAAKRSKPEPVNVKTLATRDTRADYVKEPVPTLNGCVLTVPAGSMADKVEASDCVWIDGDRYRVNGVFSNNEAGAEFGVTPMNDNDNLPPSEWSPTIGQPEAANSNEADDGELYGYPSVKSVTNSDPYTTLRTILDAAFAHAATGKGKERHGSSCGRDLPFDKQPMLETTRLVGPGFPLGQAIKKAGEAAGMIERGQYDAAEAECLGAINYLAGAVAWMREQATMRGKEAA